MMKFKRFISLSVSLALLMTGTAVLSGCGKLYSKGIKSKNVADLMANVSSGSGQSKSPDEKFTASSTKFAVELFKNEYKNGHSTLVSPLSVISALAMTQNGAEGETLTEIEKALGGIDRDTLNAYIKGYYALIGEGKEVSAANSLWLNEGVSANPDFLKTVANYYFADVFSAPFSDRATYESVNGWVKKNTDGMIPEIINSPADIAQMTMLLINAIAFDANWETPYTKYDISSDSFMTYSNEPVKAEYMHSTEHIYHESDHATSFVKPYKGGRFAFAAILPKEGTDIDDFIKSLDGESFAALTSCVSDCVEVSVTMPKFKCEYSTELIASLEKMGIKAAFDPQRADFSSLLQKGDNPYIDTVIHKTFIEVDEHGTKAAAATLVGVKEMAMREEFTIFLDRPFVYAVIDTQTNLPLFVGVQTEV